MRSSQRTRRRRSAVPGRPSSPLLPGLLLALLPATLLACAGGPGSGDGREEGGRAAPEAPGEPAVPPESAAPDEAGGDAAGVPGDTVELPTHPVEALTGHHTALRERERAVIRTEEEWRAFRADLPAGASEPEAAPAPEIDFGEWMVLVAASGRRPTGGHSVVFRRVYVAGGEVVAVVVETRPGSGCMTPQILTFPAAAVRVPAREEPVRFVEEERVRECR